MTKSTHTLKSRASRSLAPDFLGFNANMTSLNHPWEDTALLNALCRTHAGNLRYPAGTIGNYWNWDTGWLDANLDPDKLIPWMRKEVLNQHNKHYALDDLSPAYEASGATLIFMLNMVTKTLDNQLVALHRAVDLGIPVRRVELGNEYFFGPGAEPYVHARYPTVEDYAREANHWANAIKKAFPGVRIAAIGSDIEDTQRDYSERRRTWNQRLIPLLSDAIDALTVHIYFRLDRTATQAEQIASLKRPSDIAQLLSIPTETWSNIVALSHLPQKELWLTEFNLWDGVGAVRGTWAHALVIAATLDTFLRDPRVNLACLHNFVGGGLFGAVFTPGDGYFDNLTMALPHPTPYALAASGQAVALFGTVLRGATTATPLACDTIASNTLFGWRFDDGATSRVLLVNLSAEAHHLDLSDLDIPRQQIHHTHATPATYVTGSDSLCTKTADFENLVTLPAYAISTLT